MRRSTSTAPSSRCRRTALSSGAMCTPGSPASRCRSTPSTSRCGVRSRSSRPAFLAGVPSVVKPATPTGYIAEAWVRILVDSGLLPDGSLQLVSGSVPTLFEHLRLGDLVGFTGSVDDGGEAARSGRTGRAVHERDRLDQRVGPRAGCCARHPRVRRLCQAAPGRAHDQGRAEVHGDPPRHRAGRDGRRARRGAARPRSTSGS